MQWFVARVHSACGLCRWEESGKYDPGMLEWGGENIEQSMRVWMCGGEIYVARDSLVGHIFSRPAKPNPGVCYIHIYISICAAF